MRISHELVARFLANRAARRALDGVVGSAAALSALETQRKAIWSDVHRTYGISTKTKLKVELDGSRAGELRYKDGRVYEVAAPAAPARSADVACGSIGVLNGNGTLKLFPNAREAQAYAGMDARRSVHAVVQ
jgi:hypothetical protein